MSDEVISLIKRSAKGDFEAHRALAEIAIAAGLEATGNGEDAFINYYEASIFARMAASTGLLADRARLMGVLAVCAELASKQGSNAEAEHYSAEGLGLAELVADANEGAASEFAASIIASKCGEVSRQTLALAKGFKELWGAE